jgi:hypothetical protein
MQRPLVVTVSLACRCSWGSGNGDGKSRDVDGVGARIALNSENHIGRRGVPTSSVLGGDLGG